LAAWTLGLTYDVAVLPSVVTLKPAIRGHFKTGQRRSRTQDKICYTLRRSISQTFSAGCDIFAAGLVFWFTLFEPERR
jgi:hypothetical protein